MLKKNTQWKIDTAYTGGIHYRKKQPNKKILTELF